MMWFFGWMGMFDRCRRILEAEEAQRKAVEEHEKTARHIFQKEEALWLHSELWAEGEQFSRDLIDRALSAGAEPLPINRLTKGER